MTKTAKERFIEKANALYKHTGEQYDYTQSDFKDIYTKILVKCKYHGDFFITPRSHLRGNGCTKCQCKKFNLFLHKAKEKFNNKYAYQIYSDFDFMPNKKIQIICPIHGVFEQTPYNHIRGNGCPKCSYQLESAKISMGIFEFQKRANKVHNNKYDYSLSEYINNHTKIKIICPIHGVFEQTPHDHLYGCGCQKCK